MTERAPPARAQAHGTGRTTAYFLFSSENRSAVRDELQAEGLTVDVGSVGKALGARWKALTEDKRQVCTCVSRRMWSRLHYWHDCSIFHMVECSSRRDAHIALAMTSDCPQEMLLVCVDSSK